MKRTLIAVVATTLVFSAGMWSSAGRAQAQVCVYYPPPVVYVTPAPPVVYTPPVVTYYTPPVYVAPVVSVPVYRPLPAPVYYRAKFHTRPYGYEYKYKVYSPWHGRYEYEVDVRRGHVEIEEEYH